MRILILIFSFGKHQPYFRLNFGVCCPEETRSGMVVSSNLWKTESEHLLDVLCLLTHFRVLPNLSLPKKEKKILFLRIGSSVSLMSIDSRGISKIVCWPRKMSSYHFPDILSAPWSISTSLNTLRWLYFSLSRMAASAGIYHGIKWGLQGRQKTRYIVEENFGGNVDRREKRYIKH